MGDRRPRALLSACTLEISLLGRQPAPHDGGWVLDRDELVRRLAALTEAGFRHTRRHAAELTAGAGHDRFDFTLGLLIDGLAAR